MNGNITIAIYDRHCKQIDWVTDRFFSDEVAKETSSLRKVCIQASTEAHQSTVVADTFVGAWNRQLKNEEANRSWKLENTEWNNLSREWKLQHFAAALWRRYCQLRDAAILRRTRAAREMVDCPTQPHEGRLCTAMLPKTIAWSSSIEANKARTCCSW